MLLNYGADIERKGMNAYRPLVRCRLARFSRGIQSHIRSDGTASCSIGQRMPGRKKSLICCYDARRRPTA